MNSAYAVGASFTLENLFSPEVKLISEQLGRLDLQVETTKKNLQNVIPAKVLAARVNEVCGSFDLLGPSADAAALAMAGAMGRATEGAATAANGIRGELAGAFTGADEAADKASLGMIEAMKKAAAGVSTEAAEIKDVFSGIFTGVGAEMDGAVTSITGQFTRITTGANTSAEAVGRLRAELASLAAVKDLGLPTLPTPSGNANLGHRRGSHGGLHMRGPSAHLPGGAHVGASGGDGLVPLVGGFALGELVKTGIEHGMDMSHWESQYAAAGFGAGDIEKAKRAAWNNASLNPNASATESLKNILELNKATGNLDESIGLLPTFSTAEAAMQSIKAESLHSKFTGGNQILNFAKGLEEMGITQRGNSEEERAANTKHYTNELLRTMIASRGLFDGNALFAMTNNSGGAAQNWDERMGTTVAPILGDIMKHSKLGNADYMALKSYVGGGITSKSTAALVKYGLADESDTYTDKTGIHLNANSKFAEGASENLFDWSRKLLDRLEAHGTNIHDQHEINKVVNEIGSNKSTTMLMRALLEPGTRAQLVKEMALRDAVPDNAASVLQNRDPVLKLDALHKATDNFFTALGGPLVDPAIAGLTKLTSGINALSAAMVAHPDLTKYGTEAAGVAGIGLLGYGGGRMLGLFGGADAGLKQAATNLDAAAAHLMSVGGGVPGVTPTGTPGARKGPGAAVAEGTISGLLYQYGVGAMDHLLGWTPENQATLDRATSGAATLDRLRGLFSGHAAGGVLNSDGNALHRNDEMPAAFKKTADAPSPRPFVTQPEDDRTSRARASDADAWKHQQDILKAASQQMGTLSDRTGFVLTSFDGLRSSGGTLGGQFLDLTANSNSLDGVFRILEATGIGAARALAMVAMSGGGGGEGGGVINASFGGGGFGDFGASIGGGSFGAGGRPQAGGGGGGGPLGLTALPHGAVSGTVLSRGDDAMTHLMSLGVSREAAAAMVGNAQQESSISGHGPLGDTAKFGFGDNAAHGMFQWRADRFRALKAFADARGRDWRDEHTELEFAVEEAKRRGNSGWLYGHDVYAANQGMKRFEQYGESRDGGNFRTRLGNANMWDKRAQTYGSNPAAAVRSAPKPTTNQPININTHIDGRVVAKSVTYHQSKSMRYPTTLGIDPHGSFVNPTTPMVDSA